MTDNPQKLGPTGRYQGKIAEDDKGECVISIGIKDDKYVILDFGTSVSWLGMGPKEARDIGQALIDTANLIDERQKEK